MSLLRYTTALIKDQSLLTAPLSNGGIIDKPPNFDQSLGTVTKLCDRMIDLRCKYTLLLKIEIYISLLIDLQNSHSIFSEVCLPLSFLRIIYSLGAVTAISSYLSNTQGPAK